jgi:hypothetical protein
MKLRHLYFVLAVLGLVLPYSQFVPWIMEHHALNMQLFIRDLFANRISVFFAWDVIVSAIVLLIFIKAEGRRAGITLLWLPIVETLFVGVSLGLLFLYLRQVQLDRTASLSMKWHAIDDCK